MVGPAAWLASGTEASAAGTVFRWAVGVVLLGWVLLFVIGFGAQITMTVLRGRRKRQRLAPAAAESFRPAMNPLLPARMAELRSADPRFDDQLLLEVAQLACLLMFAAQSTGDEQAIRRLAAPSFWSTFFGRYIAMTARGVRANRDANLPQSRQTRFPVDYQAGSPELIDLELGAWQRARVRVSFSQLRAILAPGAAGEAATASATSLVSLAGSFGAMMNDRMDRSRRDAGDLSWVSWSGRYDLDFVRPAGARTDPAAALSSRTCAACGAAYRSDLAIECAHCHTERPLAEGRWQLADMTLVS